MAAAEMAAGGGHSGQPVTVAMWPWRSSFDMSPHTGLLAAHIEKHGFRFIEFDWSRASFEADLLHFHWPNEFFRTCGVRALVRTWRRLLLLVAYRAKGGRIVWTVHNVWPHDQRRTPSARLRLFLALLNGVIFLNRTSRTMACAAHPSLAAKRYAVTSQITFSELFATKPAAKPPSGDPAALGCFGLARPYKGLEALIGAMRQVSPAQATLTMRHSNAGHATLEHELAARGRGADHISLCFGHLPMHTLESFIDACDAIILPYRDIHNSGAAVLALSRMRPVMVPTIGTLPELRSRVGDDWVYCYSGELTPQTILDLLQWLQRERNSPPDLASFDCDLVAARTAQFYRFVLSPNAARLDAGAMSPS